MADENLYRYCIDSPTNATDPSGGELVWTQSLAGQPQFGGPSGFSMKVRQVLTGGRAAPGAQTWQTNDVKFIALILKDGTCVWDEKHNNRLDVKEPKGDPPYSFVDTVSADYDANGSDVGFLFVTMTRNLGIRPFAMNAGKITFPTNPLPVGNNYEATKEQWALATQNMAEPIMKSTANYVYVDRDVCRCCSKADQEKAARFFKTVWKGALDPSNGTAAILSYSDLGDWFSVGGRSSP